MEITDEFGENFRGGVKPYFGYDYPNDLIINT